MMYVLLAFVLTFVGLLLLLKTPLGRIAMDQPNQRSLHAKVIPRTGGLAIMLGVLVSWSLFAESWAWLLLIVGLIVVSLVDDIKDLPARWRFLVQLSVCWIFIRLYAGGVEWWQLLILTLALGWMVNLYNFMDGSDGLAGGMALFGFSSYAIAAYLDQDYQLVWMCLCISAASFAFLIFNFHPASIFMGDAGSVPLGFLAGSIGLYGVYHQTWPLWFPVLVFSPFIIDASVTLAKRLLKREKFWQAHRSHYYQRLVQLGWGHQKTALAEYVLMITMGLIGLWLLKKPWTWVGPSLLACCGVYLVLMYWVDVRWKRMQQSVASF